MDTITIEEFSKVEIKIGTIVEATKIPEGDKLLKLLIDFGSAKQNSSEKENLSGTDEILNQVQDDVEEEKKDIRQIMSAIAMYYPDPSVLVGKQIPVITNLEPRMLRGYESQGMIMATDDEDGIVLLMPERPVKPGTKIH